MLSRLLINHIQFCATLIAVLLHSVVISQQPVLKNYGTKEGLPSSQAYYSMQDSRGFIWIATDNGVSRFDGYSFKNFTQDDGLADDVVLGIYEDRHNRIWFRSLSGKLSYWFNDSIYRIGANDSISRNIKNSVMISFYIDSGDTLWCGIRGG